MIAAAGLAAAVALATLGEDLVATGAALLFRAIGGGRLEWRTPDGAWQELPLTLQLRRHWGPTDVVVVPSWTPASPGLSTAEVLLRRLPDPRPVSLVLVRVDPARWRFRVYGRADWSRASVAELADEAGLALAVNGPYFAEDGPLGLVVSDGVVRNRQGSRRAAHFLVRSADGGPVVVNEKLTPVSGIDQGFQGFPAVMTAGRTFGYLRTGGRGFSVREADRRTAACIDNTGHTVLLATDTWTNGVSFADLATVLGGLGCVDAMAFDGGASTALWLDVGGTRLNVEGLDAVPVVVGAERR